jgi:beta-lactamase superfamily II metal-dependent hydrolase
MKTTAALFAWCFFLLAAPALPQTQAKKPLLKIYWVDVEGGSATLLVHEGGGSLLLDCGSGKRDAERILTTAKAAGLTQIDHCVLTGFQDDHWGGVAELAARIPIQKFYCHPFPENAAGIDPQLKEAFLKACEGKVELVNPGKQIFVGKEGAQMEARVVCADDLARGESPGAPQIRPCKEPVPHPERPLDPSENARSVGLRVSLSNQHTSFAFLALGDLTWNGEHRLVCPMNFCRDVDVFQVSNHGLQESNSPALLDTVRPKVAIMANGAKKGASPETFKRLKAVGSILNVFQLHRNVETKAEDNTAPALIANDDERCQGAGIVLTLASESQEYTVEVPSKKTKKFYPVKSKDKK